MEGESLRWCERTEGSEKRRAQRERREREGWRKRASSTRKRTAVVGGRRRVDFRREEKGEVGDSKRNVTQDAAAEEARAE